MFKGIAIIIILKIVGIQSMRLSLENFDEKALPPHNNREPQLTLHTIRETLKQLGQEETATAMLSQERIGKEVELMQSLKKLVDQGSMDTARVPLNQRKDIFNHLAALIGDWRTFQSQEGVSGVLPSGKERLPIILQALSLLSMSSPPSSEKIEDSTALIEMMKESEDPRVVVFASRLYQVVGKTVSPNKTYPIHELNDKVYKLALAFQPLGESVKTIEFADILRGTTGNGEPLVCADLTIEVKQTGIGLNDRRKTKTFSFPLSSILTADPADKIAEEIKMKYQLASGSQNSSDKMKILAKVLWLRFINSGVTPEEQLTFVARALSITCMEKGSHSNPWFQDQVFKQCIDAIQLTKDKTLILELTQLIAVVQRMIASRGAEGQLSFSLLTIPPSQSSDAEPGESFAVKVLRDITSESQPTTLPVHIVRSSLFQRVFIAVLKQTLQFSHRVPGAHHEISPVVEQLLQMIWPETDSILAREGVYKFNLKVINEALEIIKIVIRPRHEEGHGFIARLEQRLAFEVANLETTLTTSVDFEDYSWVQDPQDRAQIIKQMLAVLFEAIQRDRENVGIGRKIIESQIMSQLIKVAEYNNKEKGQLVDSFISNYFALIGQICSNFIAQTPQLIRNGVLPTFYQTVSQRLPEGQDAFSQFLFAINHTTLQEEGRKLAEELNVFENVLNQILDSGKYPDHTLTFMGGSIRTNLFNLFERVPLFKEQGKKFLKVILKKAIDITGPKSAKYFAIYERTDIDLAQKRELLSSSKFNESRAVKQIKSLFSLLLNFTGNDDRLERHERNANARVVGEIFDEEAMTGLLDLFQFVSECPFHAHQFSQNLAKGLRVLIETGGFNANVKMFIVRLEEAHASFLESLQGKQIEDLDMFEFDDHCIQDIEYSSLIDSPKEQKKRVGPHVMRKLISLAIFCKTMTQFHTQTLFEICLNPAVVRIAPTFFHIQRILSKMRGAHLFSKMLVDDPETRSIYQTTQKEFNGLPAEEQNKLRRVIKDSQYFGNEGLIKELLPLGKQWQIPIKGIEEFLLKFTDFSFYTIRNQPGAHQKQQQEKNQLQLGRMATWLTSKLTRSQLDSKIKFDTNANIYNSILQTALILDELSRYSSRGWTSGTAFFQFYQLGGVHDIIQALHWFGKHQIDIERDNNLQLNAILYERCCNDISSFITRYILQDEKSMQDRDQRHQEVYMQSILTLKMDPFFENVKDFFQNVVYNLLYEVFKSEGAQNPLKHFVAEKLNSSFIDLIILLFNSTSKNFKNCFFLKIAAPGGPHYEMREGRGRGRQQPPNPANVQTLEDMGFIIMGFSRQRIIEALQQSRDNVNQAADLLFQWQGQGLFQEQNQNNVFQFPQEEKKQETEQAQSKMLPRKINEQQWMDIVKDISRSGFDWMIELNDHIDPSKVQSYLIDSLRSQTQPDQMVKMYAKIDEILKNSLNNFEANLETVLRKKEEVSTETDSVEKTIQLLQRASTSVRIVQRIIIHQQKYLEEALVKSSVAKQILKHLSTQVEAVKDLIDSKSQDQKVVGLYNKLIYDEMVLLFSAAQLVHLMSSPQHQSTELRKSFPTVAIYSLCIQIIELAGNGFLKQNLAATSFALALRLILDPQSFVQEAKQSAVSKLFTLFGEISSKQKGIKLDQKIISSISILNFEHDPFILQQIEKFTTRVLLMKQEYESSIPANAGKPDQGAAWSNFNYKQYMSYFNSLSAKNISGFQKAICDSCKIKQGKNGKSDAFILLKEPVYQELKKQVNKERQTFKLLVKSVDVSNEKQFKASKKALLAQVPEECKASIDIFLSYVMGSTNIFTEELNKFIECQAAGNQYFVPKDHYYSFESQYTVLDMLAKLTLAYPSYAALLLPSKQNVKQKNFFQWFIKEYLIAQILIRQEKNGEDQDTEVSFNVIPDLKLVDQNVRTFLNTLTGYNYLMTLNEQLVKHQLRCKFLLQALQVLHKVVKDKQTSDSPLRQKALILASLSVVEALINSQSSQAKLSTVSSDNFTNSLRVCFVRDGSNKDLNLPYSLIRILDELMTDVVDVSNSANGDIVCKCVSILKLVGEFVNTERKKTEQKPSKKRQDGASESQEEEKRPIDVPMEEQLPQARQLDIQAQESSSESEEDEEVEQPQPVMHEDEDEEDYGQEDQVMEDENEDDIDEDEGDEDVDVPLPNIMHIEDEYDEEDIDEIDEDDEVAQMMLMRHDRRNAAMNDIINPQIRQGDGLQQIHWGHPRMGDRNPARQVDWTDEEAQVQRILANLQGPQAIVPEEDIRRYRPYQQPPQPNAQAVSIVKHTFESFHVLSEKELYDIVIQQKPQFEVALQQSQSDPRIDQIPERNYRDHFGHHIFGRRPLDPFERMREMIVHDFNDDHQAFREFMIDQDLIGDPHFGLGGIFGQRHRDLAMRNQGSQAVEQYDNGDLNNQLRQAMQHHDQRQTESLANNIMNAIEVEIEDLAQSSKSPVQKQASVQEQALNQEPRQLIDADNMLNSFLEEMASMNNQARGQPNQNIFQIPQGLQIPPFSPLQYPRPPIPPEIVNPQPAQDAAQVDNNEEFMETRRRLQEQADRLSQESNQMRQELHRILSSAQQEDSSLIDPPNQQVDPSHGNQVHSEQPVLEQPIADQPIVDMRSSEAISEVPELPNVRQEQVQNMMEQLNLPEEEKKQEGDSGQTFGYDNQFLLENGIDPAILAELPEELRVELLSTIVVPQPTGQQQPHQEEEKKQEQQQPANQPSAADPGQPANPVQPAQAQRPEYYAIAQELGIDIDFLENLPEEMRLELIQQQQQQQLQQAVPPRQAEEMDMASFLATVTDPSLRREILMGLDQAALANLPPSLIAEARSVNDAGRRARELERRELERQAERQRMIHELGMPGGLGNFHDMFGAPGNHHPRMYEEMRYGQQMPRREKTLEDIISYRQNELANENTRDDIALAISSQLVPNEKIIEALLLILLSNEKAQCDLLPALIAMTKIQAPNGVPIMRNKIVNALTFLLKAIGSNDIEALKAILPTQDLKQKQAALILIGTLRLLLKSNKGLMKFILRGLATKEDSAKNFQTQILKKQFRALNLKSDSLSLSEDLVDTTKHRAFQAPSTLAEIFSLIKSEGFKKDKALLRNLSLLIQQILKQFSIAKEELEISNQQISSETIQSIADVLSLESIEQNLLEALGDFFYQLSLKKKENFDLISAYCSSKSSQMLENLNERLMDIILTFKNLASLTPARQLSAVEARQLSSNSGLEEEKLDLDMVDSLSVKPSKSKQTKMPAEEERQLKQLLRFNEDSDILFRIFKMMNQFYDKFSDEKGEKPNIDEFVRRTYESETLSNFTKNVSDVMKIVYHANIDLGESVSNILFCVYSSFYPELLDSFKKEEEQAKKQDKGDGKFMVKMAPLTESSVKSKEKFTLFKNSEYFSPRIEQLNLFCLANKRVINKLIKSKPALFVNELEGLIRHMPNLLDFDNKRIYFRKELSKMKRGQFQGQIDLFIRRDNIFRDSYDQLNRRSADELKARFHINFNGERGQDAGGLTRDFFIELSREMFNPNYSLFSLSSSGATYYPNPKSHIFGGDHLNYFKFVGRIIGKAIFDECLLECYFVKALYKIIAGEELSIKDLEDFDNEYYNNLKWCLENDVACLMTTMSVEQDYYGKIEEIELVPGGKTIPLTNDNKWTYVEKIAHFRLYKSTAQQIDKFLEGFYELIPKELIGIFNFKELELLISGLPNFDLDDLKANTEYSGYSATSPQVLWLWEVLEVLDNSERAEFLQFVTGSSKVPLDGFKGLIGMRGPQKFTISKIKSDDIMRLPSGHTCFNQLDLPEYPSKEILHERLLLAIKETKGFGFA